MACVAKQVKSKEDSTRLCNVAYAARRTVYCTDTAHIMESPPRLSSTFTRPHAGPAFSDLMLHSHHLVSQQRLPARLARLEFVIAVHILRARMRAVRVPS